MSAHCNILRNILYNFVFLYTDANEGLLTLSLFGNDTGMREIHGSLLYELHTKLYILYYSISLQFPLAMSPKTVFEFHLNLNPN